MNGGPFLTRRVLLAATLVAGAAASFSPASAQPYPSRPVTIITPFAAGSVPVYFARNRCSSATR